MFWLFIKYFHHLDNIFCRTLLMIMNHQSLPRCSRRSDAVSLSLKRRRRREKDRGESSCLLESVNIRLWTERISAERDSATIDHRTVECEVELWPRRPASIAAATEWWQPELTFPTSVWFVLRNIHFLRGNRQIIQAFERRSKPQTPHIATATSHSSPMQHVYILKT